MQSAWRPGSLLMLFALVAAACADVGAAALRAVDTPTPAATATPATATPLPGNLDQVTFIEDGREYTIAQLLPRDGIRPIYDPQFVPWDQAIIDPEELVMGVAINGDARAYPVGVLRSREMVNDVVGGTPVLITW